MTLLCFEAHRKDGKVWSIRHNGTWSHWARVVCEVPMLTVYKGPKAKQPRAYLTPLWKKVSVKPSGPRSRMAVITADS